MSRKRGRATWSENTLLDDRPKLLSQIVAVEPALPERLGRGLGLIVADG
jgi:hypothetical protein